MGQQCCADDRGPAGSQVIEAAKEDDPPAPTGPTPEERQAEEAQRKKDEDEAAKAQKDREGAEEQRAAQAKADADQRAAEEAAAAKKVEEPAGPAPTLAIKFDKATVTATKKPLGCTFSMTTPVTVSAARPGCHAAEIGVQAGWVLMAVGDEDISAMTAADALGKLKAACEPLAKAACVELVFDASGKENTVRALRSPLSLKLQDNNGALVVSDVAQAGYAEKLQIQSGWTLKKVGDQAMDSLADYDAKVAVLNDAIKALPKLEK